MDDHTTTSDEAVLKTLRRNLASIQERIESACERSERVSEDVHLVAVTKYADWSWVQRLAKLHHQFGENRPQQLVERQHQLPQMHWHLIGQLQRNKVRSVLPYCGLIHSVDSLKLFQKLSDVATELNLKPEVLLQINISGEQSKSGFTVSEIKERWTVLAGHHQSVSVRGFMTMAPAEQDPEQARATFRGLREFRDSLLQRRDQLPATWSLDQLSMGMSGDFEVAIEEGATIVRVGSALFNGLTRS